MSTLENHTFFEPYKGLIERKYKTKKSINTCECCNTHTEVFECFVMLMEGYFEPQLCAECSIEYTVRDYNSLLEDFWARDICSFYQIREDIRKNIVLPAMAISNKTIADFNKDLNKVCKKLNKWFNEWTENSLNNIK